MPDKDRLAMNVLHRSPGKKKTKKNTDKKGYEAQPDLIAKIYRQFAGKLLVCLDALECHVGKMMH